MRATMKTIALLIALAATACGGGSSRRSNTTFPRAPMPQGGQWAGIWFTSWGELSISLQGSSVVGEFCQEDRNRYGRVEGTTQGNVMTLHWVTNDVSMAGSTRQTEGAAIVQFSFVDAGENQGMHMEGTWGYERSNSDGGVFRGDRSPQRSTQFLRGDYHMSCALREGAEAPPPLSTEDVGDNPNMYEEEEVNDEDGGADESDDDLDDLPM